MDPADVLSRPADGPDAIFRYADHVDGVVDVFLPSALAPSGPKPLVVLIHGGFWRQEFDRRHLRPLANALVAHDFVVATPEYRRVGGRGGWPSTGEDVTAALDVVAASVNAVAPGSIDPQAPYVLAGHSAGGHLALWGGLRAGRRRVRRIVALAPVADLVTAAEHSTGDSAVAALLGGTPSEVPEVYAEADPMGLLPGDVPVSIIHGTEDLQVPVQASRKVARALAGRDSVEYVELPGVEHFALVDPRSPVFTDVVLPRLRA